MVKITVCDIHKARGQIVETSKCMKVTKHPELRMDLCPECMVLVSKMSMRDYVKLAYKTNMNLDFDTTPGMGNLIYKQLNI